MQKPAIPSDPPAKIWELLRRNPDFCQKVDELRLLHDAHKAFQRDNQVDTLDDEYYVKAMALVRDTKESNPFAACALQWLIPDPLYITMVVSKRGEMIREFQRRTPDPIPSAATPTRRRIEGFPFGGWLTSRGPEVRRTIDAKGALKDSVDEVEECLAYTQSHGAFTLQESWDESPKPFQRWFQWLWKGNSKGQQIDFFENWNLSELANQITDLVALGNEMLESREDAIRDAVRARKRNPASGLGNIARLQADISPEVLERLIEFKLLGNYHVFAIPKSLYSRAAFKCAMDQLKSDFSKRLPSPKEFLGTREEWSDWLGTMALQTAEKLSREAAALKWLRTRYHTPARKSGHAGNDKEAFRKTQQTYGSDIKARLRRMDQFCEWVYPDFELNKILFAPSTTKSRRVGKKAN